ncbi:DUF1513 domain-containing protein [Pseudomonas syringae pv. tagetis]|uniref:DUF1513 domain-containing protein n=1 Tax=Pseudomonas syringae pv. tagetis TaxID=129140 RepID=A0ABW7NWZ4_9PSED
MLTQPNRHFNRHALNHREGESQYPTENDTRHPGRG